MVIHQINQTIGFERRQLSDSEGNDYDDPRNYWKIEDVIELWVESDYFIEGDEEIRIRNFTLESITSAMINI